jgi:hypothetical protein
MDAHTEDLPECTEIRYSDLLERFAPSTRPTIGGNLQN